MEHASRSTGLLHMEASRARISQSILKTGGGAMVLHVAPSRKLRQSQGEDERVDATGCVGPCYSTFAVFNVLGHMDIVVIYLFA
jgi:hypothetical protein